MDGQERSLAEMPLPIRPPSASSREGLFNERFASSILKGEALRTVQER
jgi:hypothetical protein